MAKKGNKKPVELKDMSMEQLNGVESTIKERLAEVKTAQTALKEAKKRVKEENKRLEKLVK